MLSVEQHLFFCLSNIRVNIIIFSVDRHFYSSLATVRVIL
jgi:hypothetical protein